MIRTSIIALLLSIGSITSLQAAAIHYETHLSLKAIKEKVPKERKYIFVDVSAK